MKSFFLLNLSTSSNVGPACGVIGPKLNIARSIASRKGWAAIFFFIITEVTKGRWLKSSKKYPPPPLKFSPQISATSILDFKKILCDENSIYNFK